MPTTRTAENWLNVDEVGDRRRNKTIASDEKSMHTLENLCGIIYHTGGKKVFFSHVRFYRSSPILELVFSKMQSKNRSNRYENTPYLPT